MPHNAGYYHAAYIIVAVVYGAYALSVWLRLRGVSAHHHHPALGNGQSGIGNLPRPTTPPLGMGNRE